MGDNYPIHTLYQPVVRNGGVEGMSPVVIDSCYNGMVSVNSVHTMGHRKKLFNWSHTVTLTSIGDWAHFFIEPAATHDMHVLRGLMTFEKKATFFVYRNPTGLPSRTNMDASGICTVFEASGNQIPNGTIKHSGTAPSGYGDFVYKIKAYDKRTSVPGQRAEEEFVICPGGGGLFAIQTQDNSNEIIINLRGYEVAE